MRSGLRLFFWGVGLFVLNCLQPTLTRANVIISEVAPAPTVGPEWVELINTDDQLFDLTGFYLEDVLASASVILTFPSGTQLASGQILVFELTSAKLNNTGDGVILKNPAGVAIDNVSFGSTEPGSSWQRQQDTTQPMISGIPSPLHVDWWSPTISPTQPISPDPTTSPTPTPSVSFTPTPVVASASATPSPTSPVAYLPPDAIQLSEVVACADTHGEWIEVINTTDHSVDLSQWSVVDSGHNRRFFDTLIPAHGLTTLSWQEHMLNNAGDTVQLIDASGTTRELLALPACSTGTSYAKINHVWQVTHQPSFNAPNLASVTSPPTASTTPTPARGPTVSPTGWPTGLSAVHISVPSVTPGPKPSWLSQYWPDLTLASSTLSAISPSTSPFVKSSHPSLQLKPNQAASSHLWSDIMAGLLLTAGGFLLTHARFSLPLPSALTTFYQR